MTNIKNSSGKIIGFTDIQGEEIIIHNNTKPEFRFKDSEILKDIKLKTRQDYIIKKLYDYYFLGIGEIASLYDVCYSNMNKQWRNIPMETTANQGRRNRSFRKKQKEETKQKISKALNEGYQSGRLVPPKPYERTPEIKEKISKSLKTYFKEHPQSPEPHIENWKKGIYDNVDFHIGIGGKFFSKKNASIIRFRSLLELFYCLKIEEDSEVYKYVYEPFHITCDNGHIYTPDLLINDIKVVELKSKKYVQKVSGVKEKVQYKENQAKRYCLENNLQYQIIYDEDIKFDSRSFKRFLNNNPQIIKEYQIEFNQPERMVIK